MNPFKNVFALSLVLAASITTLIQADVVKIANAGDVPSRTGPGKRDIADVSSKLENAGASVPTSIADGDSAFLQNLPTGSDVQNRLHLDKNEIDALPNRVLNIPSYANLTSDGWNLRFHGNVYKQPNLSQSQLDDLANVFLVDTSISSLPASQAAQARNVTAGIFVIQQDQQQVKFNIVPAPSAGSSGESGGGGAATAKGRNQTIVFPNLTTVQGDYDGFVSIGNYSLVNGSAVSKPQRINVFTQGDINGNATSYLVPRSGLTVISDIDDILRITKIYQPKEGLLNSFARPFTPWMNMPEIYANWSRSIEGVHFHYLTTTPEQITRNYMDFIYKTYPGGSFDTRPLNFSDVRATLSIRKYLLQKIFDTFPARKFALVGDVSNSDIMRDYPDLAKANPGRVCILLRNTTATDDDKLPYDTSGFQGLDESTYMFFVVPDDLTKLDVASLNCRNQTIKQNVTFSTQNKPFSLSKHNAGPSRPLVTKTNLLAALILVARIVF